MASQCQYCSKLFTSPSNFTQLLHKGDDIRKRSPGRGLVIPRSLASLAESRDHGCPLCRHIYERYPSFVVERKLHAVGEEDELSLDFIAGLRHGISRDSDSPYDVDYLRVEWCDLTICNMDLSAYPDDPAAAAISARPYVKDFRTDYAYEAICKNIRECQENHDGKHANCEGKNRRHTMPERVIDVGDIKTTPRLVLTEGQLDAYITLSYCWGMEKQPVMTLKENLLGFTKALPVGKLPKTITDAMDVTRRLGLRYLWVDTLCIIQDSSEDKDCQIACLPAIFQNSRLTLCAAGSATCMSGFLESKADAFPLNDSPETFGDFTLPYRSPSQELGGTVVVQDHTTRYTHDVQKLPAYLRAWTFEERLLSPRVLIYAENRIEWQCQSRISILGGVASTTKFPWQSGTQHDSRLPSLVFNSSPVLSSASAEEEFGEHAFLWTQLIFDYTARELRYSNDKLRAISGIASLFRFAFPEYQYVAGLWLKKCQGPSRLDEFLMLQLLWKTESMQLSWRTVPQKAVKTWINEETPSWSWASTSAGVVMEDQSTPFNIIADFIGWSSDTSPQSKLFGHIKGARLVLRGFCRRVRLSSDEHHKYASPFDDATHEFTPTEGETRAQKLAHLSLSHGSLKDTPSTYFLPLMEGLEYTGLVLTPARGGTFQRIGVFECSTRLSELFLEYLHGKKETIVIV